MQKFSWQKLFCPYTCNCFNTTFHCFRQEELLAQVALFCLPNGGRTRLQSKCIDSYEELGTESHYATTRVQRILMQLLTNSLYAHMTNSSIHRGRVYGLLLHVLTKPPSYKKMCSCNVLESGFLVQGGISLCFYNLVWKRNIARQTLGSVDVIHLRGKFRLEKDRLCKAFACEDRSY